jgi:hypothetical protein
MAPISGRKRIRGLSWFSQSEEHSEVFIGMGDFAGAVFRFPAVVVQGLIREDNAVAEIAFKVGEQHIAQSGVAIAAERKPVDDDGSHAMMRDL